MSELIVATGAMLSDVLDARSARGLEALTRRAYGQLHMALTKTAWGQRSQQTYALVRAGSVLASAERYEIHGVVNGRPVPFVGIGSVCCEDGPRGVAAVLTLIESLTRDAQRACALLFPSPDADRAEIPGFHAIPRLESTVRVVEDTRRGAPMTTVRAGEVRDLQAIAAMGKTRSAKFRFCLERPPDFIDYVIARQRLRAGLGGANTRQLQFFIAEEGITAAAYVVLSATTGMWTIEEYGDRDPTGARVGALLQSLIAREPSLERPAIRMALPSGFLPPQLEIVATRAAAPVVRMATACDGVPSSADDVLYWPNDVL